MSEEQGACDDAQSFVDQLLTPRLTKEQRQQLHQIASDDIFGSEAPTGTYASNGVYIPSRKEQLDLITWGSCSRFVQHTDLKPKEDRDVPSSEGIPVEVNNTMHGILKGTHVSSHAVYCDESADEKCNETQDDNEAIRPSARDAHHTPVLASVVEDISSEFYSVKICKGIFRVDLNTKHSYETYFHSTLKKVVLNTNVIDKVCKEIPDCIYRQHKSNSGKGKQSKTIKFYYKMLGEIKVYYRGVNIGFIPVILYISKERQSMILPVSPHLIDYETMTLKKTKHPNFIYEKYFTNFSQGSNNTYTTPVEPSTQVFNILVSLLFLLNRYIKQYTSVKDPMLIIKEIRDAVFENVASGKINKDGEEVSNYPIVIARASYTNLFATFSDASLQRVLIPKPRNEQQQLLALEYSPQLDFSRSKSSSPPEQLYSPPSSWQYQTLESSANIQQSTDVNILSVMNLMAQHQQRMVDEIYKQQHKMMEEMSRNEQKRNEQMSSMVNAFCKQFERVRDVTKRKAVQNSKPPQKDEDDNSDEEEQVVVVPKKTVRR